MKDSRLSTKKLYIAIIIGIIILISTICTNNPNVDIQKIGFSTDKALNHLKIIAKNNHHADENKQAHEEVFKYLCYTLKSKEINYEVLIDKETNSKNIIGKIPGYAGQGAIALVSHYDSTKYGPGANDDGVAVATMLEMVSLLKKESFYNDIYMIFTDREEDGSMGAKAISKLPLFKKIDYILNFDARGTSGPSFMFETAQNNYEDIVLFAKANPFVRANSLMSYIYDNLQNDTDFTIFKNSGKRGFNFAYIGNGQFYHSPHDNINNVNIKGMKENASYMYYTLRRFANEDLKATRDKAVEKSIYFNYFNKFIIFKTLDIYILFALTLTLTVLLLVKELRYGLSVKKIFIDIIKYLSFLGMSFFTGFLAFKIFLSIAKNFGFDTLKIIDSLRVYSSIPNFIMIIVVSVLVGILLNHLLTRCYKFHISYCVVLIIINIIINYTLIEASFLFNIYSLLVVGIEWKKYHLRELILIPTIFMIPIFLPLLYSIYVGIGIRAWPIISLFAFLYVEPIAYYINERQ